MTDDACTTDTVLATAKQEWPVTIAMVDTLIDMAGYSIGYWVSTAHADADAQTYRVVTLGEFAEDYPAQTLTFVQIADAIAKLAFDDTVQVTPYIRDYARSTLIEQDAGEIDGEMADVVIQLAMFNEIVFG